MTKKFANIESIRCFKYSCLRFKKKSYKVGIGVTQEDKYVLIKSSDAYKACKHQTEEQLQ